LHVHRSVQQSIEERRLVVSGAIDRKHRSTFGQFFTPAPVADFMAGLLEFTSGTDILLLDPGAGIGSLTEAAVHRAGGKVMRVTCYELEPKFQEDLRKTLDGLPHVEATIQPRDFIEHSVLLVTGNRSPGFTHAILNPPYKKINTGSPHRMLMRKLGLETTNLYTCFLAGTIALCAPGAQVVAIIPRSFMNGVYFRPFRYWLLDRVALTHIHVFDRRDAAFSDDEVLQENVILRMVVGAEQGRVDVSSSTDQSFSDVRHRQCDYAEIVTPGDAEQFLHVPTLGSPSSTGLPGFTLRELGLDVCTGPVVDFRLRDHINLDALPDAVPLLYASHFAGGRFEWPKQGRKPNSIFRNAETERWLMPKGCYVILRRFSSKEEKRRVVAYLFDGETVPGDAVGFENHLNVIHEERRGLPLDIARGLVAYLNSQEVDDYFRVFSGHTQVNATDLRRLKYPSRAELKKLGEL
jgi:adenine-specific DNA-methyltransferase